MSATSHLRDADSGELIPIPAYAGGHMTTYDVPVNVCPSCSEHFPEGVEFEYVPQADEYVCRECADELRGIN